MPRPTIPVPNRAANLWAAMSWRERPAFLRMVCGGRNAHRPGRHRRVTQERLPLEETETENQTA